MKQKVLLLMVLALGMCSINVSAQSRTLETEKNGYQWYRIISKDRKYGAEGIDGSTLIPLSRGYDVIIFHPKETIEGYFTVTLNSKVGVFDIKGKEIIEPYKYDFVIFLEEEGHVGYYSVESNGLDGVCDVTGKEIIPCRYASIFYTSDGFACRESEGEYFFIDIKLDKYGRPYNSGNGYDSRSVISSGNTKLWKVCKGGRYGLTNSDGKEIVPCEMEALESAGSGYLRYKLNGFWGLMNCQGKILIDTDRGYTSIGDYKTFNKRFAYTMNGYKGECDATGRQISKIKVEETKQPSSVSSSSSSVSSSSSSSSSSNSSSRSNNSGNNTATVVVEHHRDPIPVQEWQECTVCWGSGTCPDCSGHGNKYIGDNLRRCWRCGGRGRCSSCSGQGGRYITVYR